MLALALSMGWWCTCGAADVADDADAGAGVAGGAVAAAGDVAADAAGGAPAVADVACLFSSGTCIPSSIIQSSTCACPAQNCRKLSEIVENCRTLSNIVENCRTTFQTSTASTTVRPVAFCWLFYLYNKTA